MDEIYNYLLEGILAEINKISYKCRIGKLEYYEAQIQCNKIRSDIVLHINRNLSYKKIVVHSYFENDVFYMDINNNKIPIFKISD